MATTTVCRCCWALTLTLTPTLTLTLTLTLDAAALTFAAAALDAAAAPRYLDTFQVTPYTIIVCAPCVRLVATPRRAASPPRQQHERTRLPWPL